MMRRRTEIPCPKCGAPLVKKRSSGLLGIVAADWIAIFIAAMFVGAGIAGYFLAYFAAFVPIAVLFYLHGEGSRSLSCHECGHAPESDV